MLLKALKVFVNLKPVITPTKSRGDIADNIPDGRLIEVVVYNVGEEGIIIYYIYVIYIVVAR